MLPIRSIASKHSAGWVAHRRLLAVACGLLLAGGCSLLIPLDEFTEDGGGGRATTSSTATTTGEGGGVGGGGGAGGGGAGGCSPMYASDPNNCAEPGRVCGSSLCTECVCTPEPYFDSTTTVLLFDFGLGQTAQNQPAPLVTLTQADLMGPILSELNDLGSGWGISTQLIAPSPSQIVERILPSQGEYFYPNAGIRKRAYGVPNGTASDVVCTSADETVDTFDHLARDASYLYRSVHPAGATTGRLDQCFASFTGASALSFAGPSTSHAWEIETQASNIYWTNRTLGGGVYRKSSTAFGAAPETQVYTQADGIPTGLAVAENTVYFSDCARGELYRVLPGTNVAELMETGFDAPYFVDAARNADDSVSVYVMEFKDVTQCSPVIPIGMSARITRVRDGQRLMMADGVVVPSSMRVIDEHLYYTDHAGNVGRIMRVPR